MFLLDTNVVSELRRPRPHQAVLEWLHDVHAHQLRLSVMTIAEIQRGIEQARDRDVEQARAIEAWLNEELLVGFVVLPIDDVTAQEWGRLMSHQPDRLAQDAMIAATANVHGLTVVTRNVRDFEQLGVATLNPFVPQPRNR